MKGKKKKRAENTSTDHMLKFHRLRTSQTEVHLNFRTALTLSTIIKSHFAYETQDQGARKHSHKKAAKYYMVVRGVSY